MTGRTAADIARRGECDARAALFLLLKGCADVFDGAVASAGESFAVMAEREMASIFSIALTQ